MERIRRYSSVVFGAVLLAGSGVWAQFPPDFMRQGKGGFGGPENQSMEFIQSFDANGDGQIDKAEFLKAATAIFDLMDLSADGKIDAEEARRDPAASYGNQSRWAGMVIDRYDLDDDGKLSSDEAPFGAIAFARGDTNKDVRLERRELTQMAFENAMLSEGLRMADSTMRIAQSFLKKYDKSRDGKITADEFEWGPDSFAQYDRNGDKVLELDEIGRIPPLPRSPRAQAKDFLKQRDKDTNGQLTLEESALPADAFHSMDLNADGLLTLDEVTSASLQQPQFKGRREGRLDVQPGAPLGKGNRQGADPMAPPLPRGGQGPGAPVPPPVAKPVAP